MWDTVKNVAGAFVIVYGLLGGYELAKRMGRREAEAEFAKRGIHFKEGEPGEAIQVEFNGELYYIKFEKVEEA